ncbi:OmpH family outer membrane protein [Telmatospirillum sp.]|uniref:OmpH family outer membrane protein n=1 Tax=Telmatospirillum sp. TaxID=2079197 RepID=UPI00284A14DE|nr:OmpH family outer membrane protein [Telmatospirillum sp.]MDR3436692.1 OmpH family outer membrane protein [Telmatospirillum sp.]
MSVLSKSRLLACSGLVFAALAYGAVPAVAQDEAPAGTAAPTAAAVGAAAGAAAGAGIPAPVIAIVDVDQVFQEAAAARGVRTQAEKFQQTFQNEMSKEENSLRTTQQEIDQQRKTLSQEAFAEKARAFDASVAEFQKKGMARRRALDKSLNTAMGQVQQAMLAATQQVAASHGANVVLPRSQVVLFDDKMNITKEITAVIDKKLPHVEFPTPKVELEATAPVPSSGKKSQ